MYKRPFAIMECRGTPPLKNMTEEHDLPLPEWFVAHPLALRHLGGVVGRFKRVCCRRQALEIAAVVFVCLASVSNDGYPMPVSLLHRGEKGSISDGMGALTKGIPQ